MTANVSALESLQGTYSDLYKDVYGFRPRGGNIWNDAEALSEEISYLCIQLERVMQEDADRQAIAVADFEQRVTDSAGTREDAIRWIAQAMDNPDPDFLCYDLGIPYGYLGKLWLFERETA